MHTYIMFISYIMCVHDVCVCSKKQHRAHKTTKIICLKQSHEL